MSSRQPVRGNCAASRPRRSLLVAFLLWACLCQNIPAEEASAAPSAPPTVKVAGIVLKWIRQNKAGNMRRVEPLIRQAAAAGAQVVSTTECFLDGYAIADKSIPLRQYRELGERIPDGPYCRKLAALADELNIHLIAGMLEADSELRYNTAVILGPDGKLIGKYHKQKLLHEFARNAAGKDSPVFVTPFGKVGLMICSDRTDPRITERFCSAGARFVVCPSGGMFGPLENDPIVQARSRENEVTIVFVHPAEFLVTGPEGQICARQLVGDRLWIDSSEAGGPKDESAVFYFDVPLVERTPDP
jgi:predicted amidohydrolase